MKGNDNPLQRIIEKLNDTDGPRLTKDLLVELVNNVECLLAENQSLIEAKVNQMLVTGRCFVKDSKIYFRQLDTEVIPIVDLLPKTYSVHIAALDGVSESISNLKDYRDTLQRIVESYAGPFSSEPER